MFEFNEEYYFNKGSMLRNEYSIGDKVYYLNEKKDYKIGRIKEIETDDTNNTILYLVSGCQYLRTKEHIYGLYI